MKYNKGDLKMKKQLILAVCAALGLSGCTRYVYVNENPSGPYVAEEEVVVNTAPQICQTSGNSSLCPQDQFVNYTRTAADYRAYGERTPRSHMISQAAAGNNISASVPPSIDSEVIEYEEQIAKTQAPAPVAEEAEVVAETTVQDVIADAAENTVEEVNDVVEVNNIVETTDNAVVEDPVLDWIAEEGQTLKGLLTKWSDEAGWRLVWNTNRNYVLNAGAMFRGRFADVSSALIRAFARARPAPIATFYKGNRVLVVETMEDENAYE